MPESGGLRQRKKEQTRRDLLDAATRLFHAQGYEQTTIAEIAAAANISTRTFFSYYSAKEDLVFWDMENGFVEVIRQVAERRPNDTPSGVLMRALDRMDELERVSSTNSDLDGKSLRGQLVASVPDLQAQALRRLSMWQRRLSSALHEAFPDQLDLVDAAALVGGVVGARVNTTMMCTESGMTAEEIRAAVERATERVLQDLDHRSGTRDNEQPT